MTIQPRTQSWKRKAGRIMGIALSILLVIILILVGYLLAISPGKPAPVVDSAGHPLPGSISEKIFIEVNGTKQGMFIRSKDLSNPVLLYLHGGMPDYFLNEKYPTGLEDLFTVVWWEQRGSGMSYSANIPRETMTLEQLMSDTLTVTHYLRQRFGKDKIYLMGHSGGSFTGIQVVKHSPELYYAYIGVAQMSYQLKSEKVAYDYMLERFKAEGNTAMVRKLEAYPVTLNGGVPKGYDMLRDTAMHSLGIGTTRDMDSIITGIILPSLASRQYSFMEKFNMWTGKAHSGIALVWNDMVKTDLNQAVPEVSIPVYFFEGIYDYTCAYSEAKAYFETLKAPVKGFYTFQNSAHSPIFEEADKSRQILREDVLRGTNTLADIQ